MKVARTSEQTARRELPPAESLATSDADPARDAPPAAGFKYYVVPKGGSGAIPVCSRRDRVVMLCFDTAKFRR